MTVQYLKIYDNRINSDNYMFELSIGEYYELVKDHLNDNEYQRKRVRNSGSIYSLLKQDLISGCVMPPIVLAYSKDVDSNGDIVAQIKDDSEGIVILDGLQRSYTIREIVKEASSQDEHNPLNHKIRVELYVGLNKVGILYRMLTLNTGQTQMTLRHQIEIIYSGYKKNCEVPGVTLLSESDERTPKQLGEYKFQDVVDGFTSYLQQSYLTLDRMDILENVNNLKRLAACQDANLFDSFLSSYHHFVCRICASTNTTDFASGITCLGLSANPYAKSAMDMFNKSQSMTGYGNAVASLIEIKAVNNFSDIDGYVDRINASTVEDGLLEMLAKLDKVRGIAKKIGNDQRLFFYQFFKILFDNKREGFCDVRKSVELAYGQYQRETI